MSTEMTSARVIDFAKRISKRLVLLTTPLRPTAGIDIDQCIEKASTLRLRSEQADDALEAAMQLWNSILTARKSGAHSTQLLCLLTALACLILHAAYCAVENPSNEHQTDWTKLNTCILKAAKENLKHGRIAVAERLAEKVAELHILVSSYHVNPNDQQSINEYHLLRMQLAWQHRRLDLAEAWYGKVCTATQKLSRKNEDILVELCVEIGEDCREKEDPANCLEWYNRAFSMNKGDLVGLQFARAILQFHRDAEYKAALAYIFGHVGSQFEEHMTVKMFRMRWLSRGNPTDGLFQAALLEVVDRVQTDDHYEFAMAYISRLQERAPARAMEAAESLLRVVLRAPGSQRVDEVVLLAVYIATESTHDAGCAARLLRMLRGLGHPAIEEYRMWWLAQEMAQACHTLLWRRIRRIPSGDFRSVYVWCQCATSPLFAQSGDDNFAVFRNRYTDALFWQSDHLDGALDYSFLIRVGQFLVETDARPLTERHRGALIQSRSAQETTGQIINVALQRGIDARDDGPDGKSLGWLKLAMRLARAIPDDGAVLRSLRFRLAGARIDQSLLA